MPSVIPAHMEGLLAYLREPQEKANEDMTLAYFRKVFGDSFTRQKEAKGSDGYVAGHFILELKADSNKWLAGLFQGLAYKNEGLDFGQIVVGTKNFLAVWDAESIPEHIRAEIALETDAPNKIGVRYAKRYSSQKNTLLRSAIWNGAELFSPLFRSQPDVVINRVKSFEQTLKEGRKVRQKITVNNFVTTLKQMKSFFDPTQPIKTVRAFYSMVYAWDGASTLQISHKSSDQATLGGEIVRDLIPGKRPQFKEFVESRCVTVGANKSRDDFFARYDEALDAVDKDFRIKHGIYFTDLDLSKFVMWIVKQHVPELGKNYLVLDPACGSGNLVTNWRSPLELRHKVVSEIEPELLFAVEQRMRGDSWHQGKFTVVPKVSDGRGLNFLDCSAAEYLQHIRSALEEKGHRPDKPIAFLCNPPYRSDDDQTAGAVAYKVHNSILDLTGADAGRERYCCFLAQMKLICEAARDSGLPGESLLLLFTKSAWLTKRESFQTLRSHMLGSFENVAGVLLNGSEFFNVKGSWPIAFTVWRHRGNSANLDAGRPVSLIDLTSLKKRDLAQIPWNDSEAADAGCKALLTAADIRLVDIGRDRKSIREWSGMTMTDFKRDRRKGEANQQTVGGLPSGDRRQSNKKAYGHLDGPFIGFMDELTPCRVKNSIPNRPWFRLNNQFMDIKKNRCLSGPPTHLGYCASDIESAKKAFFWYALARTFLQCPYPMWADSDDMWEPSIPNRLQKRVYELAFAIGFAENQCVDTYFPANNPLDGLRELFIANPMTPLNGESFWSTTLRPYVGKNASPPALSLIGAVETVFQNWSDFLGGRREIPIAYSRPYFIDDRGLTRTAGLIQIKDYAEENNIELLLGALANVQGALKAARQEFFRLVNTDLGYFGNPIGRPTDDIALPEKTKFEKALCKRLALAGLLVDQLHDDSNFGRTKLAKLFYLADAHEGLDLQTEYFREPAGPLDQRALYNERFGIEALALSHDVFYPEVGATMVRYRPSSDSERVRRFAKKHLGDKSEQIAQLARSFASLTTQQSEIIATLYACWNDFLIQKHSPTDDEIATEFLHHWHSKKLRFTRSRLIKALDWMRQHGLVPTGSGSMTSVKISRG